MKRTILRNTVGAVLALLLLAPVPAFALTFLGAWSFFQSVPGIAQIPAPIDLPENYRLVIGMGQVPPPTNVTKLSVTATRDFRIDSVSQLISIQHAFTSFIRSASINVTLSIQRYNVPSDPFNFPPYSTSSQLPAVVGLDFTKMGMLTQGLYRLTLTITYTRNPAGEWNNFSPHTFNFRGL